MRKNQDDEQILVFRVGPVVCSVSSCLVESIVKNQALHHFPGQADFILGVLHYRGHAVSVVNLFNKFGFSEPASNRDRCFIMGNTIYGMIGFWVDEVLAVTTQYDFHDSSPPKFSGKPVFNCTLLWGDKLTLQTDLDGLFAMEATDSLKNWVQQSKNFPRPSVHLETATHFVDMAAWCQAVSDASVEEIGALMSLGEEFSPETEMLINKSEPMAPDIKLDKNTVVFPLETNDVIEETPVQTGEQFSLVFMSEFVAPTMDKLPEPTEKPKEVKVSPNTLKAIAEQYGDTPQVTENKKTEKASIEEPAVVTDTELKQEKIQKVTVVESDTAFLHTNYRADEPMSVSAQNIPQSKEEDSILQTEFFSNFTDSVSLDYLDNDVEFSSNISESRMNSVSEFSVLVEEDSHFESLDTKKNRLKQDEAVEKVANRIIRKNETKIKIKTTSFRRVASLLVSAFIVFLVQDYWFNLDEKQLLTNVPSLQLLKERDSTEFKQKTIVLETVTDKYGEEHSVKNKIAKLVSYKAW